MRRIISIFGVVVMVAMMSTMALPAIAQSYCPTGDPYYDYYYCSSVTSADDEDGMPDNVPGEVEDGQPD